MDGASGAITVSVVLIWLGRALLCATRRVLLLCLLYAMARCRTDSIVKQMASQCLPIGVSSHISSRT